MPKRPSDFRPQWEALQQEAAALAVEGSPGRGLSPDTSKVDAHEARVAALAVSQEALAHGAWETKAQDLADVLLLAEVAWTLWWGLGTFPQVPADIEERDQREIAVAYLIRGVFDASIVEGHTAGGKP